MRLTIVILLLIQIACSYQQKEVVDSSLVHATEVQGPAIKILGTVQDAGSPHIACDKSCCQDLIHNPDPGRKVVSLGLYDGDSGKYLFEATPDITSQLKMLKDLRGVTRELPDGIFLTHAHIGHYSGLMYFGKEAVNSKNVPVYAMTRMKSFLETNGPWSQLVKLENIQINELKSGEAVELGKGIKVFPFLVPHRDEFSETVGYRIEGPNKSAIFIPDIDKWEKWKMDVVKLIQSVDYAFLDATFYSGEEIGHRDISEIPHPFIIESMEKFKRLSPQDRSKIIFIHFNHTNPVLNEQSDAVQVILGRGFNIARVGEVYAL